MAVGLAGCGSSSLASSAVTPSPSPSFSPLQTPSASTKCPAAAQVGAALGMTLPRPTDVTGPPNTLPAGATAVICNYHGSTFNVIIEILGNIDPSYISHFSDRFPVPYKSVAGVGVQARSFYQSLGGGRDNEGVVATTGRKLVSVTATATPASLAQVEALVQQLL
jgi:hypothetical protein